MTLIDTISQMQAQGFSEADIAQKLKEQGYTPKEIDNSLSQSKIKMAVSGDYEQNGQSSIIDNAQNMQAGIANQQEYSPPPQAYPEMPQPAPEYTYQAPQAYSAQDYYSPQQSVSSETISEIAEQVAAEKVQEIKKTLSGLADFKSISESKISGIDERLKRIEIIIDKLQASIIKKIGDYGEAIEDLRDEMSSVEETFSKLVNPLVNRAHQAKTEEDSPEAEPPKRTKSKKDEFENYLR